MISEMLVGRSEAIASVRTMIRYAVKATTTVLVTGPSGCGKEVVARSIHRESDRADGPFLAINGGAIPSELIESELFGHEGGSFTGATSRHLGIFEQADGGTLFLDEVGEMPLSLQVKLLRVLEEGTIRRVGGREDIKVDVRIVAATNRDLKLEIGAGRFREDLFYRLCVLPIRMPSLGERREDVALLIEHFLKQNEQIEAPTFAKDAIDRLAAYAWPGNVRELRNLVERASIFFSGQTIVAKEVDLLLDIASQTANVAPAAASAGAGDAATAPQPAASLFEGGFSLQRHMQEEERRLIVDALVECGGVIAKAARMVDVQRTTFVEKMRRHGINREDQLAA
jgi:sigma-54 specific flagellar transcriptional regulator A